MCGHFMRENREILFLSRQYFCLGRVGKAEAIKR